MNVLRSRQTKQAWFYVIGPIETNYLVWGEHEIQKIQITIIDFPNENTRDNLRSGTGVAQRLLFV